MHFILQLCRKVKKNQVTLDFDVKLSVTNCTFYDRKQVYI